MRSNTAQSEYPFLERGHGFAITSRYNFVCVVCKRPGVSPSKFCKTCDPITTGRSCRVELQRKRAVKFQAKYRKARKLRKVAAGA